MLGILGLLLAVLSVVALIDPNTPIGKSILRITFIRNETLVKFYPIYRGMLFFLSSTILVVVLYLILSIIDFYFFQTFVLNVLYNGTIAIVLLPIVLWKNRKRLKEMVLTLRPFAILLFIFLAIMALLALILHYQIENGGLDKKYQSCLEAPSTSHLLVLSDSSARSFRNRYQEEIMIVSRVNMISQYRLMYGFHYDLGPEKDTSKFVYSKLVNTTKEIFNSKPYSQQFRDRIKSAVEASNGYPVKPFHFFPVEIQPNFVSALTVAMNTKYFSSLAIGSKINLIYLYNKIVGAIGLVGILVAIPFLILVSFWLTFRLARYNEKYVDSPVDANNYFFMFVSILGLLIAIISN